jgi:hypothetical protein
MKSHYSPIGVTPSRSCLWIGTLLCFMATLGLIALLSR